MMETRFSEPPTGATPPLTDIPVVGSSVSETENVAAVDLPPEDEGFRELIHNLTRSSSIEAKVKGEIEAALELAVTEVKRRIVAQEPSTISSSQRAEIQVRWKIDPYDFSPLAQIFLYYGFMHGDLNPAHQEQADAIASLIMSSAELYYQAGIDSLTRLKNHRRMGEDLTKKEMKSATERPNYAVVMIDLDNFKKVNDTYGHAVGDEVLKHLALLLSTSVRETGERDEVYRYGGEEFVLILNNTTAEKTREVLERIQANLAAHPYILENSNTEIPITCSIGWVERNQLPPEMLRVENIVKPADEVMYDVKHSTKNAIRQYVSPGEEIPPDTMV